MKGVVYKAVNKLNHKVYVGQSWDFKNRIRQHLYEAKINRKNTYFYNAIKKHGYENFEWKILCECFLQEELDFAENVFIEYYGGVNSKKNYNSRGGGSAGRLSCEQIEYLRIINIGRKDSEETKRKKSASQFGILHHRFGKHQPKEVKEKISKSLSGINHPNYGKKLSLETREKIRITKIGKLNCNYVNVTLENIVNELKMNDKITIKQMLKNLNISNATFYTKLKNLGFKNFTEFKSKVLIKIN